MQTQKAEQSIPLVDLHAQYPELKQKILKSLEEVMDATGFVRGAKHDAFEKAFSEYHDGRPCVCLNSGTDALFLAFKALGVKAGDEIITVPFTFIATAEAVVNAGAVLRFVDIDPERRTMDPALLEAAITPKTVGIVPVHLYGMPADMEPILKIAAAHKLWVVEDACQAHGALYKNRKTGTFGDAAAFSFYPSKNLGGYGDGGALITGREEIASKMKLLRNHGQSSKYETELLGYNSRLDGFQAAVLSVKLPYLDRWNDNRRQVAEWYREALDGIKEVTVPKSFADSREVYHIYVPRVEKRDALVAHLKTRGISTGVHYQIPLHKQRAFAGVSEHGPLPVSEKVAGEVVTLPMYPELKKEQVGYIASEIAKFYRQA